MILRVLLSVFIALLIPLLGQAQEPQTTMEILIPKGIPMKIEFHRDMRHPNIVKYVIKRIVPKDALQAYIISVMVDKDGVARFIDPMVGGQLTDPMSIATADKDIVRILLIVEWLETDTGKWVVNNSTRKLDIEALVKRGAKALPCAKFVSKKS